jgi:chemotaxis signal transduction protein
LSHAPLGVLGLLAYRGMLVPVVDLNLILPQRASSAEPVRYAQRLILVELNDAAATGSRFVALLAEGVTDLVRTYQIEPGLALPSARYLGEHFVDIDEMPQVILPEAILPLELRELFVPDADLTANATPARLGADSRGEAGKTDSLGLNVLPRQDSRPVHSETDAPQTDATPANAQAHL